MSDKASDVIEQYSGPGSFYSLNDEKNVENDAIIEIARTYTNASLKSTTTIPVSENPFLGTSNNPLLDPYSDSFSSKEWTKHFYKLQRADPQRFPQLEMGVSFKNLGAYGYEGGTNYQKTVANMLMYVPQKIYTTIFKRNSQENKTQILNNFNGLLRSGETCVVLGRPGAGCSTFLKSIASDTYGFHMDKSTFLNYQGLSSEDIKKHYRGEVIFNAENEVHIPHLTVGDTLKFAALARTPESRFEGVTRDQHATYLRDVTMATFGLLHTMNTKVGNDFIRGVSGGERRRISISEVVIASSQIQCFDNSTRGLDSATALEFIKSVKVDAEVSGAAIFVSLYQASQDAYDLFDKATVLYLGKQIYYGPANKAKKFFEDMGYVCIDRQTTGDFLTSLTSPSERVVKPGYEKKVPRTPEEFEAYWMASPEYAALIEEVDQWNAEHPLNNPQITEKIEAYKRSRQSSFARLSSPYFLSYPQQVGICVTRGIQRLKADYTMLLSTIIGDIIAALLVSSIFYNQPKNSGSFYFRGASIFFAVLFNSLSSLLEVFALYLIRPIAEKHHKYSFYHPSAEAISSQIVDMPGKIISSLAFNLVLYFMVNLKRTVGGFFTFYLFGFMIILTMSALFRTIASLTRTISEAMTPASFAISILITTTGFIIPVVDMHPWIRWLNYVNPLSYCFEAMMINEFRNTRFPCSEFVPSGELYDNLPLEYKRCSVVGSKLGEADVSGADYIIQSFEYMPNHLWRNLGIVIAFCVIYHLLYFFFTEFIKGQRSKGEVLVFQRGNKAAATSFKEQQIEDNYNGLESSSDKEEKTNIKLQQSGIYQWEDVCYDIKIKGEPRRLLDHVDGWVKPGTLTALMGASGAGKTTLLDTLADRVTMGVVTGSMLVNGHQRDASFQRKTGYAQQQDIHLPTSTVREALEFSALLRQPDTYTKEEKLAYVDEVIKILEMEKYSDAVVGIPGEGLNVEQRKRLTIGVELAARPELLLFLDEPTSGLDSQTAWSIMMLMKKLTNSGQAILCTIHQPSAVLFQQFDRLLLLKRGGQTVYYGDLGEGATKMISYFERNGAPKCPPDANPAEWMLYAIGAAPGSHTDNDWHEVWKNSPEYAQTKQELRELAEQYKLENPINDTDTTSQTYAVSIWKQIPIVSQRAFKKTWRDPQYIWAKLALAIGLNFFLGIAFWKAKNTIQGMQNQMYSIFMVIVVFVSVTQQLMVPFVEQRTLYETRERPSRTYSWVAFMSSMLIAEIPWALLAAVGSYFCFYYPVGLYNNASLAGETAERGALFFLLYVVFYLHSLTFGYMLVAALPDADTAGNLCVVLFNFSLSMAGVLAPKDTLPGFWIFMYRVSPFTYLIGAFLSTGIADGNIECSPVETMVYPQTPNSQTCEGFLGPYANATDGSIANPFATSNCEFCPMSSTNTYLDSIYAPYSNAWRNFGIIIGYIAFNTIMSYFFYWLGRVPKNFGKKKQGN